MRRFEPAARLLHGTELTEIVQASIKGQVDQLFYSPFGDYDNGATLAVTGITSVGVPQAIHCDDVSSAQDCPQQCVINRFVDCSAPNDLFGEQCRVTPNDPSPDCAAEAAQGKCQELECQVEITDAAKIVFNIDADADHDGFPAPIDVCWWVHDYDCDGKPCDCDGDGIPDACDKYPFDPNNDADRDGVPANLLNPNCPHLQNPNPVDSDNCPTLSNPNQANSNLDAELARHATLLGDKCDPVPVPDLNPSPVSALSQSVTMPVPGFPQATEICGEYTTQPLVISALASHEDLIPVGEVITVVNSVPTGARFCQEDGIVTKKDCNDPKRFIADALFNDTDCSDPTHCSNPETMATRFHRISFSNGGNAHRDGDPHQNGQYLSARKVTFSFDSEDHPSTHCQGVEGQFCWTWDDQTRATVISGSPTCSSRRRLRGLTPM